MLSYLFLDFNAFSNVFLDWETCAKIDSKIRCIDEFLGWTQDGVVSKKLFGCKTQETCEREIG